MKQAVTDLVLLTHADVYAPQHHGIRHLLICAGRIAWIGEEMPQMDRALAVQTIDLRGARVIPGLIDCHAHVTRGRWRGRTAHQGAAGAVKCFHQRRHYVCDRIARHR